MRYLGLGVRRLVETTALLFGLVLGMAAIAVAGLSITTPECSVDLDSRDGVLVVRTIAGAWIATELIWSAVAGTWFLRASPERWSRVLVSVTFPVGVVVLWGAAGGLTELVLDGIDAGAASSSCW